MDEIPDFILEGPKLSDKPPEKVKTKSKTSSFLVTIDPNISASTMVGPQNKEARIARYRQLLAVKANLADKFGRGELLKPFGNLKDWHPPRLTHLSGDPEFGPTHGRLHIHLSVSFDGTTHLDRSKIINFIREETGESGWNIQVEYIHDSVQSSRDYALKSSNPEHLEREINKFRGPIIDGVEEEID